MIDQFQELQQAGVWLGPAVLGALCYQLLADSSIGSDELAGAVMLATSALLLTVAGLREQRGKQAAVAPLAFVAMFLASWSMR
jgi:hypothetical protein